MARPTTRWLTGVALPLCLALMEAAWLFPWSVLLGSWLRPDGLTPLLAGPAVVGLLLGGLAAMRATAGVRLPERALRLLLILVGALLVLVVLRLDYYAAAPLGDLGWLARLGQAIVGLLRALDPVVPALAAGMAIWARGLSDGAGPLSLGEIDERFRFDVAALAAALLGLALSAPETRAGLLTAAGPAALAFVPLALAARSLARLADVRALALARGGTTPVENDWLAMLAGVVGGLALLALLLAQVFAIDVLATVVGGVAWLAGQLLALLILVIALPVALLLEVLIPWLQSLLTRQPPPEQPPRESVSRDDLQRLAEQIQAPPWVAQIIELTLVALIIFVGVRALIRMITLRRRREQAEEVVEERESLWRWSLLVELARAWLGDLLARLRRQPAEEAAPVAPPSAPPSTEPAPVLTLRGVYRRLLTLGMMRGAPRAPAATPYEHAPRLAERLQPPDDIDWITRAYVAARYGDVEPDAATVEEARARLARVAPREESTAPGPETGPPASG
jgi:hypothetical protein